ncbi:transposase Tn3 family protein [Burkholderia contaminans]|nr:transposase Tn3 family protein [Burkholderia contaminans]
MPAPAKPGIESKGIHANETALETVLKRLFGAPEGIPANQAAIEFEERPVNVGATLETNPEAAEVMQPRMCAFDDPAIFAQATAMFGTALGDHRLDTAIARPGTMDSGA